MSSFKTSSSAPQMSRSFGPLDRQFPRVLRSFVAPLALVSVATALYMTLLRGTAYRIDDYRWIYHRIPGYLDAFAAGQWPPRVFPHAYEGAGYAFPHFYPPLSHWIAAALAYITGSPVWGVHLAFFASVIFAALAMYELGRRITSSVSVAFVGAVVYTTLPYHFADIVVRGALAEAWAFVWFPVITAAALSSVRDGRLRWGVPLGVCGLLLSHTALALYFAAVCGMALLFVWKRFGTHAASRLTFAGAIGVALALWYLLPTYLALPSVRASSVEVMATDWAAVRDAAPRPGNALFLMDALPWLMLGVAWIHLRGKRQKVGLEHSWAVYLLTGCGTLLTLFAYFPTALTALLPDPFAYIQFPWRVFAITGFLATVALIILLHASESFRLNRLILVAAVVSGLPYMLFHIGDEPLPQTQFSATGSRTYTVVGDYLPIQIEPASAADRVRAIRERLISHGVEINRANGTFTVDVPAGAVDLTLPLHFYPFYRATDGAGKNVALSNRDGLVGLDEVVGRVTIRTVHLRPFYVSVAFSLLALICFGGMRRREMAAQRVLGFRPPLIERLVRQAGARSAARSDLKEVSL